MPNKSFVVLGISFLPETMPRLLQKVRSVWQEGGRLRIATVNPEFLVSAHSDPRFRENIRKAEIRVVDGVGLWLALFLIGFSGKRLTGVSLTECLLQEATKEKKKVVIALPDWGLSTPEKVKEAFSQKYPGLSFETLLLNEGESLPPHITSDLFLFAHGAPEQEYQAEMVKHGVALGVGGAIDFLIGAQKRAPKVFQGLGIEWLWRAVREPWRVRRILRAVIVFPLIFLGERLLLLGKIRLLQ